MEEESSSFRPSAGIGKHIVLIADEENDVISLDAGMLADVFKQRMDGLVVGQFAVAQL